MNLQITQPRGKLTFRTAACCAVALAASLGSSQASADAVTDWNAIATATVVAAGAPGVPTAATERPTFGLYVGLTQAAVYDAVNGIDRSYTVFAVKPNMPTHGASKEAAAVAAAFKMLVTLFPSQTATLTAAYDSSLAAIPAGDAKTRGIAIGTEVATKWLAKRANDGRYAPFSYSFGSGPGVYQATTGAPPTAPITPWLANVKPLVMRKPSQYRPDGPPELSSRTYATDLREVQVMGQKVSAARMPWQTQIGLFHTMNPNLFWGNNLNRFVIEQGLTLAENARLHAMLWVTGADAIIACWDAKFAFNAWRPETAIRAAATDGNSDTDADPSWEPLAVTPPHQEYPSGHSCASGSFMEVLRQYFGTKRLHLSFTSTVTNTTSEFFHTDDVIEEIADARVYGGMHFRFANEDGLDLGKRVARLVAKEHFQPKRQHGKYRD